MKKAAVVWSSPNTDGLTASAKDHSIEGRFHGIQYRLVSDNFLVWNPAKME
jgi:hypothetical protein